tara:strand:- start:19 stop:552 length:534 start_codon:yes stop_codon:yes gene_type:complete
MNKKDFDELIKKKEQEKKLKEKQFEIDLHERQRNEQLGSLNANRTRAQSFSIGTTGSGTTEITMRGIQGEYLWDIYQPTQVIELIHQLASNVGCHIHIVPREDFASWRNWKKPDAEQLAKLNGFPPFSNKLEGSSNFGLIEKTNPVGLQDEEELNNGMATTKAVNRRVTNGSDKKPS